MLVGAGGTTAELFQDRALELPPLNERSPAGCSNRCAPGRCCRAIAGGRGVNVDRLIEVLMRLSYLVADYPGDQGTGRQPAAGDARGRDRAGRPDRARPRGGACIRRGPTRTWRSAPTRRSSSSEAKLKDGTPVLLRPIKPEDEPMWHELLASCSPESIRFRFRYLFKQTTHEMATRFCFIDYDREIAIVAEIEGGRSAS